MLVYNLEFNVSYWFYPLKKKDKTNKEYLKLLKTRIIDNNSFKKFENLILRAIKLKDGFEFISFDNPTLMGQCFENSKSFIRSNGFESSVAAKLEKIIAMMTLQG